MGSLLLYNLQSTVYTVGENLLSSLPFLPCLYPHLYNLCTYTTHRHTDKQPPKQQQQFKSQKNENTRERPGKIKHTECCVTTVSRGETINIGGCVGAVEGKNRGRKLTSASTY